MQKRIGALLAYLNVFAQNGVYLLYTPLLLGFLGKSQYGFFSTDESNGQYLDYFDDGICWCVREVLLDCEK